MVDDKGRQSSPAAPRWPAVVAAARACVGTRFRSQGRAVGLGLDCVGVALLAAAAAGKGSLVVPAYALGGDNDDVIEPILAAFGCRPVGVALAGDILVTAPAPRQRHLAVVTPAGVVHAHAGLGRVVEGPLDGDWTIIGAWRLPGAR
jgi:murein DD-endopeptidase / murein LD-carboxypeptidase